MFCFDRMGFHEKFPFHVSMSIAIAIVLVFCLPITYIIWNKNNQKKRPISLREGPREGGLLEGPTGRKGKGESDPILIVIENVFLKWG